MCFNNFLAREPGDAGVNFFLPLLNSGTLTRTQMAYNFFGAPEFNAIERFVIGLYYGILGRDPDFYGWDFHRRDLHLGIVTQDTLVTQFLATPEYAARYGNPDQRRVRDPAVPERAGAESLGQRRLGVVDAVDQRHVDADAGGAVVSELAGIPDGGAGPPDGVPVARHHAVARSGDGGVHGLAGIFQFTGQQPAGGECVRRVPEFQAKLARLDPQSGFIGSAGDNNFEVTSRTAEPTIGTSDSGGRGKILSGSLEASTVDIAKEFTNLIVYQRDLPGQFACHHHTRRVESGNHQLEALGLT